MSENSKPYKETLNLPVTRFEMKANLTVREPQIQQRWREADLYGQIRQARAGSERKVLHDGPPYANGEIHMGHLLNKVLKDIVVRSLTMQGFDSPYVPGWDCHGLPIEHKVVKDLGSKAATMSLAEIRTLCQADALKWVDLQRDQFRRLGVSGDWDNPYLTLDPRYEAGILDVLADLLAGGYVFRQLKPIHWCMNDRTALAEAELEYRDESSPSIYVNFPIVSGVPAAWGTGPWHAMVWTTTPWTLPANVAIAAHPDLNYVGVRYVDPESGQALQTILAADLLPKVMALRGVTEIQELGRCRGKDLEHAQYRHPFIERTSPIVLAQYVTVEDGTGLVHTAPGHGTEDYQTGRTYQLPTLSPVDGSGRFTDEAPAALVGKGVFKANPEIIALLRERGYLYHEFSFVHSYPHCWRCKKPVIFRATEQWFIGVDRNDLRARTLKEIDSVRWLPGWGKSRIDAMVTLRPDWCISRQRSWGVPIPALGCNGCETQALTAETVRHFRDLFRKEGADAWYTKPVEEILPPGLTCSKCGGTDFRKEGDILDVWFESGASHRGVLTGGFELGYPAFMYLEGSDQHRGWFQSSILTAVGTTGRAPFQTVLTHGFVVDDKGQKMAKSGGNAVSAVKATEQYGADVLRLYVASMDYADDIRMSEKGIKEMSEAYRKIRNTFRYMLGNLEDYASFDPASVPSESLHEIDRWALRQLDEVASDVKGAYERFEFYRVFQRIYQFCSVELSSFYLDVLKDRLYAELPQGPDRRAAQFVLAKLHDVLTRLLAPLVPHTAEELWELIPDSPAKVPSVHLAAWPEAEPSGTAAESAIPWKDLLVYRALILRETESLRKGKKIGSNQEASVELYTDSSETAEFLTRYRDLLTTICIVAEIDVVRVGQIENVQSEQGWVGDETHLVDLEHRLVIRALKSPAGKCERCWNLRPTVGQSAEHPGLCDRCAGVMSALNSQV
ncbi:isoleucine--tRNA ligase [Singulisphaera acidiphila]|uniref:Isoleucine--tRNA ligase n=1 Tax=Singulisphaera acidiphila (strain ATCC BAA-1392 / DSM 18658 / VKM B-2454 / MOB10) TaxID=886293 RepID=L0D8X8_SINAD|nr:isoleucine--tRNA ligase [Singulisphaera acidiphila]AGA25692.1 isoleucyl-tRNA synthetase [Singulisphaera acidiphila DSM 18658]